MRKYLLAALILAPCSSYAVLPYIFANQPAGNVPASYLDTDFSLLEDGVVQPVISTGIANSYAVAPSIAWVGGYSNYANVGLLVNFNAGNTGPSSINVSGLGAANMVKNVAGVATALASGDVNTNVPYLLINDGTQFWVQNVIGSTTSGGGSTTTVQFNDSGVLSGKTTFEFISSTNVVSITGLLSATNISTTAISVTNPQNSGLITAGIVFNGVPSPVTIIRQQNVTSVTPIATGRYILTGTFPSNPIVNCNGSLGTGSTLGISIEGSPTTTSITIQGYNTASGAVTAYNNLGCNVF